MPTTPTATMKTGPKQGWEKTCDCGFMVRDYNKGEFVSIINTHLRTSHNMAPMSEPQILETSKAIKMA